MFFFWVVLWVTFEIFEIGDSRDPVDSDVDYITAVS